jgi:competence protein ComGC
VELLVVIAIIAVRVALLLPALNKACLPSIKFGDIGMFSNSQRQYGEFTVPYPK